MPSALPHPAEHRLEVEDRSAVESFEAADPEAQSAGDLEDREISSHASGAPSSPCFGACSRLWIGDRTHPIGCSSKVVAMEPILPPGLRPLRSLAVVWLS